MASTQIEVPDAARQVAFHQLLVAARKTRLIDALGDALSRLDPNEVKSELAAYVPVDAQAVLAANGIRDEHVFPVPIVLESKPTLVGYYRLLLGLPQKPFYRGDTGMGKFKSMEVKGTLSKAQRAALPEFCKAMREALANLVRQVSPQITPRDVNELPLLTLGQQFQGANNVTIGQQAIQDVFLAINAIVERYIVDQDGRKIVIENASQRTVVIALAQDPDVAIQEEFSGALHKNVAVEVKGGTDASNAHNRAGEAEKSHRKAKNAGFRDFWTIIAMKGLDTAKLRQESPTTTSWFDIAQVLGRQGGDWNEFRRRIAGVVGIPD
ncbi:MAG: XcyI family restriction endonuclease [Dehalococcoidales bacterium]|nr:XcyI family restriction endonuclease [Dehalococcoidales bacterium]